MIQHMSIPKSSIQIVLLLTALMTWTSIASSTLTPLQNLSINGGGKLLPLTNGQIYSADLPPAWQAQELWQQLEKSEDHAVILTPGQPLIPVPAAATCPSEPIISSPTRQAVSALSRGRFLTSGGSCLKNKEQHQGYAPLWLYDPGAVDGQHWQQTGYLQQPRLLHTSTTLPDDSVLLIGGVDPIIQRPADQELPALRMLGSVEMWREQGVTSLPPLPIPRAMHSATRLPDGQILVAGGLGADLKPLRDTWFYRLGEPHWRQGPDLPQAVFDHAALQTTFGLMIAGGRDSAGQPLLQTLLLRDVKEGFIQLAPLMLPLAAGQLAQNLHGELLLSGGYTADNIPNPILLRWDGAYWQQVLSQVVPNQRDNWSVQAQADGQWLLGSDRALYKLELADESSGLSARKQQSFSHYPRGGRHFAKIGSTVVQLPDGRLLVAGGGLTNTPVATTFSEVMDPKTGRWQQTAPTRFAHYDSEAIVLSDGRVLLFGGISDNNSNGRKSQRHQVELFNPTDLSWQILPELAFAADERVQARLLSDGAVLFVAANEYNTAQYTQFRAVRFEPDSGKIQQFRAPASSFSADPLQPPTTPLPLKAFWQIRPDGSVALLSGHFATYIAEPDCFKRLGNNVTTNDRQADSDCSFDEDMQYGWQESSASNDQIWLWHVFNSTIEPLSAAKGPKINQLWTPGAALTSANGDLLFKQRGPEGQTLLRFNQLNSTSEWLPPHPLNIWSDERLYSLISWSAVSNGGVVVADHYLAPGSQTWQELPELEMDADWIGGQDSIYAVNFASPYNAKLIDFDQHGGQSASVKSADAKADATSPSKQHEIQQHPARWQLVKDMQLPAAAGMTSSLLALRNGDVLQALQQDSNQLRLQIWRSDIQQWQVLPAPSIKLYGRPMQFLLLADDQIMLVAQVFLPRSSQTELHCYLSKDSRQVDWQPCGTFAITDNSEFALSTLDDGSPALMINHQQALLFDIKTNRWHPQVPYQNDGELIQGVAVRLAVPLLSLGDPRSGQSQPANALGAKFLQKNGSGAGAWQWSATKQHWAYILRNSQMPDEAVELSDGCWLGFKQQQFVLFNPRTAKVELLPERYALENTALAKRPDDRLLLVGNHEWQRGDGSLWFQASCKGVTPLAPPGALATPISQLPPDTAIANNDIPAVRAIAPAPIRWQTWAIALAPWFYPFLVIWLLSVIYYRHLTNRGESATKLKWVMSISVLLLLSAGYGQKIRQVAVSGEVSPLSESCISQMQYRLKNQSDASNWPTQLNQCMPMQELPQLDCRFLGRWSQHNEQISHTTYLSQFDANGRYKVTDPFGDSPREYLGYWAIWQNKLVWFSEHSLDPFADANPIVSISKNTIVIRETNGSKTTLRRQDNEPAVNCPASN